MKAKRFMMLATISSVLVSSVLSGCGSGSESGNQTKNNEEQAKEKSEETDGKPIEITFWGLSQQENYEPIAEAFNKEQDKIKVKISNYDTEMCIRDRLSPLPGSVPQLAEGKIRDY